MKKIALALGALALVGGLTACGNAAGSQQLGAASGHLTLDGQPFTVALQNVSHTSYNSILITVVFTNNGDAAVDVGSQVRVEVWDTSPSNNNVSVRGPGNVLPGQTGTDQVEDFGAGQYRATRIEISVDANSGSGVVNLPINDPGPTPSTNTSNSPPPDSSGADNTPEPAPAPPSPPPPPCVEANGSTGYSCPDKSSAPASPAPSASPTPQPVPSASPSSPPTSVQIQGANNAPAGIVTALATYFNAINSGDYALAYAQLGPDKQKTTSEANFARGDATSQDTNVAIGAVNPTSNGSYLVDVSFTSQQSASDGPNGDQCDNWTLRYTMINSGGSWLIDATTGQNGVTHTSCE